MRETLLPLIACPDCHADLVLDAVETVSGRIRTGSLFCTGCAAVYPVRNFVPRFAPGDDYARSFSVEWTTFCRTQLDSLNGLTLSARYFRESVGATPPDLTGQVVLDAGCGAGRFLDLFRNIDATVIGIDLSFAVDSAAANCADCPHIHVVQANIFRPPFRPGTFDFAYSIGVLHHTPAPRSAFSSLATLVKPGGNMGVRVLEKRKINGVTVDHLFPLYFYRGITSKWPPEKLLAFLRRYVPIACRLRRLPVVGQFFRWALPVADYRGVIPEHLLPDWNVLDTLDRFSPRYYFRYDWSDLKEWFEGSGFTRVTRGAWSVSAYGNKVGRFEMKPTPSNHKESAPMPLVSPVSIEGSAQLERVGLATSESFARGHRDWPT